MIRKYVDFVGVVGTTITRQKIFLGSFYSKNQKRFQGKFEISRGRRKKKRGRVAVSPTVN